MGCCRLENYWTNRSTRNHEKCNVGSKKSAFRLCIMKLKKYIYKEVNIMPALTDANLAYKIMCSLEFTSIHSKIKGCAI